MKKVIILFILFFSTICYAELTFRWDANPEPICPSNPTMAICLEGYSAYATFVPGDYSPENSYPYPFPIAQMNADKTSTILFVKEEDCEQLFFVLKAHARCWDTITGEYRPCESGYSKEVNILDFPETDGGAVENTGGGGSGCFINSMRGQ